jgi:hypothetical protein
MAPFEVARGKSLARFVATAVTGIYNARNAVSDPQKHWLRVQTV